MMPVLERCCEWTGRTRRTEPGCGSGVVVAYGDPPDPDQAGFAGTVYTVQVCKQHDPDPRQSMPLPRTASVLPRADPPDYIERGSVNPLIPSGDQPPYDRGWTLPSL